MVDLKNFVLLIEQIAEEKGISKDRVIDTIQQAIAAAYKKEYGERGQNIRAVINVKTGKMEFFQVKDVVSEDMLYTEEELDKMKEKREAGEEVVEDEDDKKIRFNPERHILLADAKKKKKTVKVGDEVEEKLPVKEEYGRIAAQTAKQVILQKIREAEREAVMDEFKSKEGELVSGVVQRVEGRTVFFDVGKTLGVMPREEQVPGEFYRTGQRLRLFVMRVEDTNRGPSIYLSRAYPKFVSKLFELEVPEIGAETVEIKGIAREPGSRSKVAVFSDAEGVDPVGSMVGQRGTRVSAVINELGGEKIDVIEWAEDPELYIANSLSPAKVLQVEMKDKNKAVAIVPEDQLSLAIGRDGQNVRLAAKLTGWKIDVKTPDGETVDVEDMEPEEKKEDTPEIPKDIEEEKPKTTKKKE